MKVRKITATILITILLSVMTFAQIDFGGDVVSRYVWRGADFGNAASVQPYLSFALGNLEIGAWASYPVAASAGVNENDLYLSYAFGNFSVTITDYYFPEEFALFDLADDGSHIIEGSLSAKFGSLSLLGAFNFYGDADNSMYAELGFLFYDKDDISTSAFLGAGNGFYTLSTELNVVNVGVSASKGPWSAVYIVNPNLETNYLVLGYSLSL